MNTFIHYPLLLGALACLGACSVGPQYRAPEIAPIQLASPQAEDFAQGTAQPLAAWWTFFDDAQLARLIDTAVADPPSSSRVTSAGVVADSSAT